MYEVKTPRISCFEMPFAINALTISHNSQEIITLRQQEEDTAGLAYFAPGKEPIFGSVLNLERSITSAKIIRFALSSCGEYLGMIFERAWQKYCFLLFSFKEKRFIYQNEEAVDFSFHPREQLLVLAAKNGRTYRLLQITFSDEISVTPFSDPLGEDLSSFIHTGSGNELLIKRLFHFQTFSSANGLKGLKFPDSMLHLARHYLVSKEQIAYFSSGETMYGYSLTSHELLWLTEPRKWQEYAVDYSLALSLCEKYIAVTGTSDEKNQVPISFLKIHETRKGNVLKKFIFLGNPPTVHFLSNSQEGNIRILLPNTLLTPERTGKNIQNCFSVIEFEDLS